MAQDARRGRSGGEPREARASLGLLGWESKNGDIGAPRRLLSNVFLYTRAFEGVGGAKGWESEKLRGGVDTEAHWAPSDGSPVDLSPRMADP